MRHLIRSTRVKARSLRDDNDTLHCKCCKFELAGTGAFLKEFLTLRSQPPCQGLGGQQSLHLKHKDGTTDERQGEANKQETCRNSRTNCITALFTNNGFERHIPLLPSDAGWENYYGVIE
jgi:hypothetical protein